ncbi:MAG: multidrug effflux MFS transporter [Salaquimonas sp.]
MSANNETQIEPRHLSRFLNRRTPPHIFTLILLAGMGALNMNLILPSLPAMTEYFKTDYAIMQLAISAYLGMTAILQLIVGPLSDRYGRRPVIIFGMAVFVLSSLAAAFATSVELFMLARLTQATVVSGYALSRAVVRDMFPMEQAASMIGYVTMGMTLIPMVGPVAGGLLQEYFGWQANFYFSASVGLFVLLIIIFDLQETNKHQSTSMGEQFKSYPELVTSRRFWGFVFSSLFASGTFFAFLGGAPYVAENHLGLTPSTIGFFFVFIAVGYMFGNFLSGRFATKIGIFAMMIYGAIVAAAGVAISLIYFYLGFSSAIGFFGPLFFVGMGNGLTLPSSMAGMVSVRPHLAGSAAGLGGAIQIGGGAALSVLAGILLTPESGPFPLLWLMLGASLTGILFTLYTRNVARQMEKQGQKL